jgi:hypothetical protein
MMMMMIIIITNKLTAGRKTEVSEFSGNMHSLNLICFQLFHKVNFGFLLLF